MYEMTATGAQGEWWPVFDLEDEVGRMLTDFAADNPEAFGYPDEDAHCDTHDTQAAGCDQCFSAVQEACKAEQDMWVESEILNVIRALKREGMWTHELNPHAPDGRLTMRYRKET